MSTTVQVEALAGYMTVAAAARYKDCSIDALYQQIRQKQIPHVRIGRQILVRPADLVGYTPRK